MNNETTTRSLIRLVGVMAIAVAAAWALQVLEFDGSGAFGRLMWVVAAAVAAGIGVGLLYSSSTLDDGAGAEAIRGA